MCSEREAGVEVGRGQGLCVRACVRAPALEPYVHFVPVGLCVSGGQGTLEWPPLFAHFYTTSTCTGGLLVKLC